ncbi:MAG: metallophosphoesterase [Sarcina sp.]
MKFIKFILLFIMICLYGALNYFVAQSINHDMISFLNFNIEYLIWIVFIIGTICTILIYGFFDKNIGAFAGKIGIYAFGFSIMSFFLILISNGIAQIVFRGKIDYRYFGIIQIAVLILVFLYGRYNSSKVKIRNYAIKLDKNSDLDKLDIVLISDLHLGYFNDNKKFARNVERINNLNADIVVISGDLFDQNFAAVQHNEETKRIFNSIKSKYGTYLSFGNHDSGPTYNAMKDFVMTTNINLLEDKAINLDNKFIVAGRRDFSPIGFCGEARNNEWNVGVNKDLPLIVLEHQPMYKEYDSSTDIILSGHTHKGQIFPFNLATKLYFENHYGYLKLENGIHTVVTSGLGTWGPPVRIGSNNEIVKIRVEFN